MGGKLLAGNAQPQRSQRKKQKRHLFTAVVQVHCFCDSGYKQAGERGHCGQYVSWQLRTRNAEKKQRKEPKTEEEGISLPNLNWPLVYLLALGKPNGESKRPGEESEKQNRDVIPEGLDVLEFGSKEALEIVLNNEDAQEVRIAAGTEDVPRQGRREE